MEGQESRHHFKEGDLAFLIDRKDRRYMVTLDAAKAFHTHVGLLQHAAIIGQEHGARLTTTLGQTLLVLPPTLEDYITNIPRATQVIYPKDLGAILVYGDIFPGARVVEAGLGSGALTIALLRGVGPQGAVFSYEVREDVVERARRNIQAVIPDVHNLTIRIGDVYQEIQERDLDRVVLDLPEPWQAIPQAAEALAPGGILLAFLPTALQVYELGMALQQHPSFDLVESREVIVRPWHVAHRSVRPVHRMVAHTGFIVTARRCAPTRAGAPPPPKDASSSNEDDADEP
ncbi:MAG: tRNA (adenine-N1)-methyltransferase [Dehalococcoidia bacterium]|nr:tRNA (adenine-N1)-methyltransferase [Dehalococcoidia bacterium]